MSTPEAVHPLSAGQNPRVVLGLDKEEPEPLERWVRHDPGCPAIGARGTCDCGLQEALDAAQPPDPDALRKFALWVGLYTDDELIRQHAATALGLAAGVQPVPSEPPFVGGGTSRVETYTDHNAAGVQPVLPCPIHGDLCSPACTGRAGVQPVPSEPDLCEWCGNPRTLHDPDDETCPEDWQPVPTDTPGADG